MILKAIGHLANAPKLRSKVHILTGPLPIWFLYMCLKEVAGSETAMVWNIQLIGTKLRTMQDEEEQSLAVQFHELLTSIKALVHSRSIPDTESVLIRQACRFLTETAAENCSLPDLAKSLGVGYERFRKIFNRHTGQAPGNYRIQRRIDKARELLIRNKLNSKEIAHQLGYADQFVFSKQFKQFVGEAPEEFRRRMAK